MQYGKQLKLLLWKNITLRKRQPIRFLIEIIWPTVLLALLALVRTRNLQETIPECHFDEKALPSAGTLPLLQSYICAFNNTCRRNSSDDVYGTVNMYHDSMLSRIAAVLSDVFHNTTAQGAIFDTLAHATELFDIGSELSHNIKIVPRNGLRFSDVFPVSKDKYHALFKQRNLSQSALDTVDALLVAEFRPFLLSDVAPFVNSGSLFCDVARLKKVFSFENGTNVQELSRIVCRVQLSAWYGLLGPVINMSHIRAEFKLEPVDLNFMTLLRAQAAFQKFRTVVKEMAVLQPAVAEIQEIYSSSNATGLRFIGKFLCGSNAGIFENEDKFMPQTHMQRMRESQMSGNNVMMKRRDDRNVKSNVSSEFCHELFDSLEQNTKIAIRFVWKPLKSFVLGKLLYTPDTPLTRRIVKRMNETFDNIGGLLLAGQQFSRLLPEMLIVLDIVAAQNSTLSTNGSPGSFDIYGAITSILTDQGLSDLIPMVDPAWFAGFQFNSSNLESWKDRLDALNNIVSNATQLLSCFDFDKFVPVRTEAGLNVKGVKLVENGTFWAGIVFESLNAPEVRVSSDLPPFVRYKIRYDVDKIDSTIRVQDRFWRPHPRRQPLTDMKYYTYGFIQLQDMVERALMTEMLNSTEELPGLYLQQFPYPCYISDTFFMAISRNFPLLMTLAWVYTAAMTVKSIVYEKEKRLKETMMMMGLSSGANWMAWFLETFLIMQISIVFMVIILVYGAVLIHSHWFFIYIFLVAFSLSTIAFSFFLSVFFSKANIAAAAGGIVFFTTFMPYSLLINWEDRIPLIGKAFSCLIPNIAFGWGSNVFARREEQGIGVQFDNFAISPLDDGFNLVYSFVMLLGDALMLFILAWYLEAVMPGQYGIARPWYFPIMSSYWMGTKRKSVKELHGYESAPTVNKPDVGHFEPEPLNRQKGVEIRNLRKVYHNGKTAVDGLSLNVYEGITALLGHNGAGKTTTFSILCGLFPATSGSAKIYGYDVQNEMDRIRESFGFCPQHNVLWDDLTVDEHLRFYASLKISDPTEIATEVASMIDNVGLPHKQFEKIKNLSGGMQRKLSVAIAYIGGAKVVLLDEPTAGVDPWARRGIWNLLIRFRKNRTTIMSTHFHGEADTLSDRIAVIADGRLVCSGSPVFLKSRFGCGYYLTVVKSSSDTNEEELGRFIRAFVPEAVLIENVGSEMSFILPTDVKKEGRFEALFEALDTMLARLNISSYGIRDTSLEEVFLRVMDSHNNHKEKDEDLANGVASEGFLAKMRRRYRGGGNPVDGALEDPAALATSGGSTLSSQSQSVALDDWDHINVAIKRVYGPRLALQQMKAMHIKRFHNLRRSKKSFFCEILLPALFVCLAMVVTLLTPVPLEQPALELTPWLYGPPNYMFFADEQPGSPNTSVLLRNMYEGPGIGTRCMKGSPVSGKSCIPTIKNDISQLTPEFPVSRNATPSCSCDVGGQICPRNAGGPMPPCMLLNTTDWLCNMTGRNVSDWLTKTAKNYDSTRYGGYSFGEVDTFAQFNFTVWKDGLRAMVEQAQQNEEPVPHENGLQGRWRNFAKLLSGMFTKDNIKVWFNNRGWASSVSYTNAINNVILRSRLKAGADPYQYGIMAVNHPLNRTEEQMEDQIIKESAKSLLHAVCIIFAMSFVPASFVMFLIDERVSGAKNLQFTAKVKPWLYWVSTYIWDIVNYSLTACICIMIFLAFNEQAYVSSTNAPALICLLFLYGFAAIPMMYIPSYLFKVPSSAFVALACANLFLGLVSTITVFILELLDDVELQEVAAILRKVFLVLPHYCLGRGLMDLAITNVKANVFSRFGQEVDDHPFEWTFMGRNVFCMMVQGIVFFLLTILIEYRFFVKPKRVTVASEVLRNEDRDVAAERARVAAGHADNSVLTCRNLSKAFKKRKQTYLAVDNISFAVEKGECFGLLGVNGAGKTTTFKMLTGNLIPTSGDALVNGHSICHDLDGARQHIGYCPQFDAIYDLLSGREHLEFYARIHGIPEAYVKKAAEKALARLQLVQYADRSAGGYSGGNKRKLSTAIALIGNPDIVYLDEPTTGMDPKARRFLWNSILSMIREGRSVTLTSHSLEECENLCTKLAIMVNGRFQCFGSVQHLKSRFGFGYSVVIRCKDPEATNKICDFMESTFPDSRMQEMHYNTVQYRIPLVGIKLSYIFGSLERNRDHLQIEDFSVNQTNLEDIFIEFAKHQTDLATDEFYPGAEDVILSVPQQPPAASSTRPADTLSVADTTLTGLSPVPDMGRYSPDDMDLGVNFVSAQQSQKLIQKHAEIYVAPVESTDL